MTCYAQNFVAVVMLDYKDKNIDLELHHGLLNDLSLNQNYEFEICVIYSIIIIYYSKLF